MAESGGPRSYRMLRRRTTDLPLSARQWLIFYHESMTATARQVKEDMGENGQLSELEWNRFNDGFPNLAIKKEDAERLEHFYGCCFIVSLHCPGVIFEQLALLYSLPKLRARNFRIILPWFSTGTMERVEQRGQVATASSLARLLSCCPMGPGGPPTIVIYEIHALQEQFYFSDSVLVELKSAMWLLLEEVEELRAAGQEFAIVFPDDGAHKRFKSKFSAFPQIICSKVRCGDERKVTVKEGLPEGRHCIIVDDLVQSGGTLLECAAALKERGGDDIKVSCFVTHAVFPKESWKKFVDHPLIDTFWVTNSIPTSTSQLEGQKPFKVLSLAPLIAKYLSGVGSEDF